MSRNRATVTQIKLQLENSQYKCALTGWPLASDYFALDHIHPICRGGDDSAENLQCLHPDANKAKGTLTQEEFIRLCHAVAAKHPLPR